MVEKIKKILKIIWDEFVYDGHLFSLEVKNVSHLVHCRFVITSFFEIEMPKRKREVFSKVNA